MKITVIIPAYNAGKYIDKAITSVLDQKGLEAEDIRLIVVNDCSSDDTAEVLAHYLEDPRVTVINHDTNKGVATSRNEGIELAQTEYVAFLDADDWWSRDKLSKQLEIIEESGAPLVCTARELHSPEGESTGRVIGVRDHISYDNLLKTNSIPCGSVLMRTELAREFEFKMDNLHEDYILWLEVTKKYGDARGIDEPMLHCRLSEGGKSRNKLKSAKMHYKVYRYLGINPIKSIFLFISYAFNGVKKYYG